MDFSIIGSVSCHGSVLVTLSQSQVPNFFLFVANLEYAYDCGQKANHIANDIAGTQTRPFFIPKIYFEIKYIDE
jgi:hypothetical protein